MLLLLHNNYVKIGCYFVLHRPPLPCLPLQGPPLCVLGVYYGIHCYVCPYCSRLANALEVVLLGGLIILLYIPFLPLSPEPSALVTSDECGYPVHPGDAVTAIMGAVYFSTLVLSVVAIVVTFGMKKFSLVRKCSTKGKFKLLFPSRRAKECQPAQIHSAVALVHYTTAQVDLTETLNEDKIHSVQDECDKSNCWLWLQYCIETHLQCDLMKHSLSCAFTFIYIPMYGCLHARVPCNKHCYNSIKHYLSQHYKGRNV